MGNYKDKNGTTRVGDFLRSIGGVAPDLLKLAGEITGIETIENLGKKIKGSKELTPNQKEYAFKLLEQDAKEMEEITKRWSADMTSDSWLSKNVRPLALIFLTIFMTVIIVSDSKETWSFEVKEAYITLLETLLLAVYLAYFGGRSVEKYKKIK